MSKRQQCGYIRDFGFSLLAHTQNILNNTIYIPNLTHIIADVYDVTRDDLIIDCTVSANPRPTIVWLKNDEAIEFDERIQQVEHEDGVCELIINKPTRSDNGNYSCTATNYLGSETETLLIDFHPTPISSVRSHRETGMQSDRKAIDDESPKEEDASRRGSEGNGEKVRGETPPTFTRRYVPTREDLLRAARNQLSFVTHLKNRVFPVGTRIKLTCVVQGTDPNVKWYKNENPVVFGPRVRNMSREGLCVLEITKSALEDSGEYLCVVRNSECEISSSCKLQVYDAKGTADLSPTFTRSLKGKLITCTIQ